jgi:hypothetical protein
MNVNPSTSSAPYFPPSTGIAPTFAVLNQPNNLQDAYTNAPQQQAYSTNHHQFWNPMAYINPMGSFVPVYNYEPGYYGNDKNNYQPVLPPFTPSNMNPTICQGSYRKSTTSINPAVAQSSYLNNGYCDASLNEVAVAMSTMKDEAIKETSLKNFKRKFDSLQENASTSTTAPASINSSQSSNYPQSYYLGSNSIQSNSHRNPQNFMYYVPQQYSQNCNKMETNTNYSYEPTHYGSTLTYGGGGGTTGGSGSSHCNHPHDDPYHGPPGGRIIPVLNEHHAAHDIDIGTKNNQNYSSSGESRPSDIISSSTLFTSIKHTL